MFYFFISAAGSLSSKPIPLSWPRNAGAGFFNLHFCFFIWFPINLCQSMLERDNKVGGESRGVFLTAACSSWEDHLSNASSLQESNSFLLRQLDAAAVFLTLEEERALSHLLTPEMAESAGQSTILRSLGPISTEPFFPVQRYQQS